MAGQLNIGLTAWHAVGNLAFVKVPSERGRYMLTDLCVIVVPCPNCGAIIGEPCRSGHWSDGKPYPRWANQPARNGHGVSVHVARKLAAEKLHGRHWKRTVIAHYKLHLAAGDIAAAMADAPPMPLLGGDAKDIDFEVVPKGVPDAEQ